MIVQDPCHLRHVQRAHRAVRTVLAHVADVVELDDDGAVLRRRRRLLGAAAGARRRDPRPQARRHRPGAGAVGRTVVASANPGCAMHLAAAGVDVRHPVDIVAEAIGQMSRFDDLADRLEAIVGELDELSFDLLQQAVADGATQRPAADRSLTQARRAVEKAAGTAASGRRARRLIDHRVVGDRRRQVVGRRLLGGGSATNALTASISARRSPQRCLRNTNADPRQLDVVVVAALDVERAGALDRARGRRGGRSGR